MLKGVQVRPGGYRVLESSCHRASLNMPSDTSIGPERRGCVKASAGKQVRLYVDSNRFVAHLLRITDAVAVPLLPGSHRRQRNARTGYSPLRLAPSNHHTDNPNAPITMQMTRARTPPWTLARSWSLVRLYFALKRKCTFDKLFFLSWPNTT
jgi:hypothetical protein